MYIKHGQCLLIDGKSVFFAHFDEPQQRRVHYVSKKHRQAMYQKAVTMFYTYHTLKQGWKLQTVRLSGTGKNGAGQVKILDTFPKDRLKFWKLPTAYLSGTGKNSAGQVILFDTFPIMNYFVISTPA